MKMRKTPLTGKLEFKSLKPCDLSNCTKEQIKEYFLNTYDVYESLFTAIDDDAYYVCPDRLRLPLIFYYGHTAAVYMNKLVLCGLVDPNERIHFPYDVIFETGVDEMSWDDIEHYRMGGDYIWPTVEETREFRRKVKELILKVIDRTPLTLPVQWDTPLWGFFLGFEHERIHLETSSVLMRQLPISMVSKPDGWVYGPLKTSDKIVQNEMIRIPETDVRMGKDFDYPSFGWDNEYGRVDCRVSEFEASKFKITNEEYLEFIKAKGYETKKYWTEEGWEWLQYRKLKHPTFWVCPNGCKSGCGGRIKDHTFCTKEHFTEEELKYFENPENLQKTTKSDANPRPDFPYKLRLMFDVVTMPYNWPAEVVYHEAKAFCNWKGKDFRLLTEAEHHAIRDNEEFDLKTTNDVIYQSNNEVNHNLVYGSSTPVDLYPSNSKGFNDVFGNVWEWCEDNFNGLPGFKTTFIYDDFSTPCFDGRHNIIMGGSWVSTGDEASRFARFMFRRHFVQHCGFRLARSIFKNDGTKPDPQVRLVSNRVFVLGAGFPNNPVTLDESRIVVNSYPTMNKQYIYDSDRKYLEIELEKDYNEDSDFFHTFYKQLNIIINEHLKPPTTGLQIGSSTGRTAFELAKVFNEVIAIDFCAQFIQAALTLQQDGIIEIEHEKGTQLTIKIDNKESQHKLTFKNMTWLSNEIPVSQFVLFSMIDRVSNPYSWLRRLRELVDPNGILVIQTHNLTWNSEKLKPVIGKNFRLLTEINFKKNDSFSVWKLENKSNWLF